MKKTILITGSTDGIGKLTALKLAKEGYEIFVHGRNAKKLEMVISEIKTLSKNDHVNGFIADFSDIEATRDMAKKVNRDLSRLDILINNAGVYKSPMTKTKDGFDIRFVVNYFAPFLLTGALLPLLKKSTASRIINLSSAAQAPVALDAMIGDVALSEMEAYSQSKLALTMWSLHLAETEPNLIVIPVNPGSLLNTNMVKEGWGFHRSSADKGRDILFDLAIDDKYAHDSGRYFDNDSGGFGAIHPAGENRMAIQSLIKKTSELLL